MSKFVKLLGAAAITTIMAAPAVQAGDANMRVEAVLAAPASMTVDNTMNFGLVTLPAAPAGATVLLELSHDGSITGTGASATGGQAGQVSVSGTGDISLSGAEKKLNDSAGNEANVTVKNFKFYDITDTSTEAPATITMGPTGGSFYVTASLEFLDTITPDSYSGDVVLTVDNL